MITINTNLQMPVNNGEYRTSYAAEAYLDYNEHGFSLFVVFYGMPRMPDAWGELPNGWTVEASDAYRSDWKFRRLIGAEFFSEIPSHVTPEAFAPVLQVMFTPVRTTAERVDEFTQWLDDTLADDCHSEEMSAALRIARDRVSYLVRDDRMSTVVAYLPDPS
jgi:hypothetical protein